MNSFSHPFQSLTNINLFCDIFIIYLLIIKRGEKGGKDSQGNKYWLDCGNTSLRGIILINM